MRNTAYLLLLALAFCFSSCVTSNTIFCNNDSDILKSYKYCVFGRQSGDLTLDVIMMDIENEIGKYVEVVSSSKAATLSASGEKILSPKIQVKTETWDGGQTYVTIVFYDYDTEQRLAILNSSGIGLTIQDDQSYAKTAMFDEIRKAFGVLPQNDVKKLDFDLY